MKQIVATLFVALFGFLTSTPTMAQEQPRIPDYIGSPNCQNCHETQMSQWQGSDHQLAWLAPSEENVLGDFGDVTFEGAGLRARFYRDDDRFMIDVTEPDEVMTTYSVHSTAGIEPLQQYLLGTENGKLQSFDVAWDTEDKKWFHLYPESEFKPGDGMHWTGPYKNWNARCAECHATGFEKNFDPTEQVYRSTVAENGVSCEACHGPGQAHAQWAELGVLEASEWNGLTETGLTIGFSADDAETEVQQCAGCHSRRESLFDGNPLPGTLFNDAYRLAYLAPGLYHADGTIQGEVYVFGSFLQSKMGEKGVRCSNCHEPHTTKLKAEGNAVCTQCHSTEGNSDFPSLTLANYDSPSHYFHEAGSEGAQCKNCHMPERVYMGIDKRSDHSFRIPRPDLSVSFRTPNTCTDCHSDQTAEWAAATLSQWYPNSMNGKPIGAAEVFSAFPRNPQGQVAGLVDIAENTDLPAITRATALYLLRPFATPEVATRLAPLIEHADPMIRATAVGVQRGAPPAERIVRIVPALADPVRTVRIAAAKEMNDAPIAYLPDAMSADNDAANAEWRESLDHKLDFPEAHLIIGGAALGRRDVDAALDAFREATRLDPQLVQAWSMTVRIYAAIGEKEKARETLAKAFDANPASPVLLNAVDSLE